MKERKEKKSYWFSVRHLQEKKDMYVMVNATVTL
jgi:hypothetical protein